MALSERFGTVISPDFREDKDLGARIQRACEALQGHEEVIIVGSSFGGLLAAVLANMYPIKGLLLCAPALHHPEAVRVKQLPANTIILHGVHDDVVPISYSHEAAKKHNIQLIEVDDDHRLLLSNELICDLVDQLMRQVK